MWINCLIQTIVLKYWSKLICIQKLHKNQKKEGNRNGGEWIKDRVIIGWNWSEGDYRGSSKYRYIHRRRINTSPCRLSPPLFLFLALYSISSIPVFKIAKRRCDMLRENSYTTERTLQRRIKDKLGIVSYCVSRINPKNSYTTERTLQRRIKDKLGIVSYCVSRINPKNSSFNGRSFWKILRRWTDGLPMICDRLIWWDHTNVRWF
jgi:hypothetical protein